MDDPKLERTRPFGMDEDEEDIELPVLPKPNAGPRPECPFCGESMSMIDGEWGCTDCNGELIGPETG